MLNKGQLRSHGVLRFLWIDLKGIVENLSYICRGPKSKHIIGGLAIIALILNTQAPKLHIIEGPLNKAGPTLSLVPHVWGDELGTELGTLHGRKN